MNNYYFTFGYNHRDKAGNVMRDWWVRVKATGPEWARDKFIDQFTTKYMDNPARWSMQYDDNTFDPSWFPKGELLVIN